MVDQNKGVIMKGIFRDNLRLSGDKCCGHKYQSPHDLPHYEFGLEPELISGDYLPHRSFLADDEYGWIQWGRRERDC